MNIYKILIRAGLKQHKGSLFGVFVLLILISASFFTLVTMWTNSNKYVEEEMEHGDFGDLTLWTSGEQHPNELKNDLLQIPSIDNVNVQQIIYSDYDIGEQSSDSEGQIIKYNSSEERYRIFNDSITDSERKPIVIHPGEIYVSPSMISMFGLEIGDEISFMIARDGKEQSFIVKGYYEDPFMGSAMIGMKGFLVCEADWIHMGQTIQDASFNALARIGNMFHIKQKEGSHLSVTDMNMQINQNTAISKAIEEVHSSNTMLGFMMVLQNTFGVLLLAFVFVLFFVVLIVIGHNVNSAIEQEYMNLGILKSIGATRRMLQYVQLAQYLLISIAGIIVGSLLSIFGSRVIRNITKTTTGILYPTKIPLLWFGIFSFTIIVFLVFYILFKTRKIKKISPLNAIQESNSDIQLNVKKMNKIHTKYFSISIAIRQIISGKNRYIATCIIAICLVFFASLVVRMDSWLGNNGEGLMDAFNPADLDIGIQIFGKEEFSDVEEEILKITEITDSYLLAMPNVGVNGVDYTANVITEPKRLHILEGNTCENDTEIVITEFVAADMNLQVGDIVTLKASRGNEDFVISGIYECANDMGDNIGMSREGFQKIGQDSPNIWCHHIFLANPLQKQLLKEHLESKYGGDVYIHENSWPGLNGIIIAMRMLLLFMYCLVIIFIMIVTVLSGKKILTEETKDIGIYKAIGLTTHKLRVSFALRFGITSIIGSMIGVIMSTVAADPIISYFMKYEGISDFSSHPNIAEILFPAFFVVLLFFIFAYILAGKIKRVSLAKLANYKN